MLAVGLMKPSSNVMSAVVCSVSAVRRNSTDRNAFETMSG